MGQRKMKYLNFAGQCHSGCHFCAREYFAWMKDRVFKMSMVEEGMTVSFMDAANTSVKPTKDS